MVICHRLSHKIWPLPWLTASDREGTLLFRVFQPSNPHPFPSSCRSPKPRGGRRFPAPPLASALQSVAATSAGRGGGGAGGAHAAARGALALGCLAAKGMGRLGRLKKDRDFPAKTGIFLAQTSAQEWRRIDIFQQRLGFESQKGEDWDFKRHERWKTMVV